MDSLADIQTDRQTSEALEKVKKKRKIREKKYFYPVPLLEI